MKRVVVITGHTFTGKTRLAKNLKKRHGYSILDTSNFIKKEARKRNLRVDRRPLQMLGDTLDAETNSSWLIEAARRQLARSKEQAIVVDNIRSWGQLRHFRAQHEWKVTHIHLYGSKNRREEAFLKQQKEKGPEPGVKTYEDADLIKNEPDIRKFKLDADIRIFTDRTDAQDVFARVTAQLGHVAPPDLALVDVLVGGQFGSEGKGHVAAYLAREYDVLIRVGGPNAGHTVASGSGEYTYHHLPSGCRDTDAEIIIGPGATIYVPSFLKEVAECSLTPDRLYVDPQASIIEEYDRQREQELSETVGSTASGSGAAAAKKILERGTKNIKLARDIKELQPYVGNKTHYRGKTSERLEIAYQQGKSILLEGTQGSGLSIHHGYYPYVTSRDTNVSGCLAEAGISPRRVNRIIMVIRPTPIRVADPKIEGQTSGPLKHETSFEIVAKQAGLNARTVERFEKTSTTKKDRRVGWFDWELFSRSCALNCPTDIVLTFADYIKSKNEKARRYDQLDTQTIKFIEEIERVARAPVSLINTRFPRTKAQRFDLRTVIDRRDWSTRKGQRLSPDS